MKKKKLLFFMVKLVKKVNFITVLWILFYFLVFGFLLKNSFSYLDPDLGWHLKVGEAIAQTGMVPHLNIYNYTFTGRWVDHEWLINLASFEIYSKLGYEALNIIFALVILVSLILLNLFVRKTFPKTPIGILMFLQIFGLIASAPSFGIRMQEFGFLFLLLELWIIKNFNDKKSWRSLIWLLPLFYLWSNIHGSFLFGLGILLFWLVIKLVERGLLTTQFKEYFSNREAVRKSELKVFSIFSLGSVALTFLTPYGLELYSFLNGYANTFYLKSIQEWLSQFTPPFLYWQLAYLILFVVVMAPYFYNVFYKKVESINLWQLGLAVLFLILAFKSRRNFPLMFLATLPFIIKNIYNFLGIDAGTKFKIRKELKYFLLICLSLAAIGQYISLRPISNPFSSYCTKFPCQATEFLKTETKYKDLTLFNDYNWGGYLIWVYPEKKIFIDGRLPQVAYGGHTFLEEYYEFFKPNADYESKLAQYNIKLVLTKTNDDKIQLKNWEKFIFQFKDSDLVFPNRLRNYLDTANNWQKIYSDSLATIYLKIN